MELKKENWVLNTISAPEYEMNKTLNEIFKSKNYTKDF